MSRCQNDLFMPASSLDSGVPYRSTASATRAHLGHSGLHFGNRSGIFLSKLRRLERNKKLKL